MGGNPDKQNRDTGSSPEIVAAQTFVKKEIKDRQIKTYTFRMEPVMGPNPNIPGSDILVKIGEKRVVKDTGDRVRIGNKGGGSATGFFLGWDETETYLRYTGTNPTYSGDLEEKTVYVGDVEKIEKLS